MYKIILDMTAFFPEAGGQASDLGYISDASVFDVQIEGDTVIHYCDKPIAVNTSINCTLDFERRFSFMQNHSGEHIISGIAHSLYGAENVGFHLYRDFATVDFDIVFTSEQLLKIELLANKAVWENRNINCYFPAEQELKKIKYRYKKDLEGDIRLVDIEGVDICACCAPHVSKTGEIGVIKLLDFERLRSGVRIILKCGSFALNDYNVKYKNIKAISGLLSAKQDEVFDAVCTLNDKLKSVQQENSLLKKRYIDAIIDSSTNDKTAIFDDTLDIKELQILADGLHRKNGHLSATFSKCDNNFLFAMCHDAQKLDHFFNYFKNEIKVRGGGRNGMIQGTAFATKEEIEKAINEYKG